MGVLLEMEILFESKWNATTAFLFGINSYGFIRTIDMFSV